MAVFMSVSSCELFGSRDVSWIQVKSTASDLSLHATCFLALVAEHGLRRLCHEGSLVFSLVLFPHKCSGNLNRG